MIVEYYETGFEAVKKAMQTIEGMEEVVNFLRKADGLVTCYDIGIAIYGKEEYTKSHKSRSYSSHLGHILKALCNTKCIERIKVDGEPIEYEDREWIVDPSDGESYIVTVTDNKGRSFEVTNPFYTGSPYYGNGHWETVKKTVVPKINKYHWIG